ncbi:hypothetical protein LINPERPRIM_LOCUS1598 [Linum perenne]
MQPLYSRLTSLFHTFTQGAIMQQTNYLANRGHSFPFGFHCIEQVDPNLSYWLLHANSMYLKII